MTKKTSNQQTNEKITEKTKRMMNKKTVGIVAGATVTVAAVIISLLCLSACKGENLTATPDEAAVGTSVQTVTQVVTDSQGNTHIEEETKVVEVKQTQPSEKSENAKEVNAQNTAKTDDKSDNNSGNNEQKNVSNNNSNSSQSSKTNNNSSNSNSNTNQGGSTSQSQSSQTNKPEPKPEPTTADPHKGKTWHEAVYEDKYYPAETEQVWVVDEEGYTWERPIYESHRATICNICGAEITGHIDEHDIAVHFPYGEDFSYRIETVRTLVGYETVEVPEKGHYETRVTKEAHTERELIREAGWY